MVRRSHGVVWVRCVSGWPTHTFDDIVHQWTVGPRGGINPARSNRHHGDRKRPQGKAKGPRALYRLAAERIY